MSRDDTDTELLRFVLATNLEDSSTRAEATIAPL